VLSNILKFTSRYIIELKQFLKSTNFSKSILVVIALSIPLLFGIWLGYTEIGLAICFGAFWSSPSDVHGSQKHKILGISNDKILIFKYYYHIFSSKTRHLN